MPKKWLKVRAKLNSNMKTFNLAIIEQSHKSVDFGGNVRLGEYRNKYFLFEDVAIISHYSAMCCTDPYFIGMWKFDRKVAAMIFVGGVDNSIPPTISGIPVELWPKVKGAVRAYNEYFKS